MGTASAQFAADADYFVGAWGGISAISADGRSTTGPERVDVSLYKPENSPTAGFYFGRHLAEYVSVQGSYLWNRNSLLLTSSRTSDSELRFYEQERKATIHSMVGELMVYVRNRKRRIRPYLTVGVGMVQVSSSPGRIVNESELRYEAPGKIDSAGLAIRSAVGVDIFFGGGWALRYSFVETIRGNPISKVLTPPGTRRLANFQNLVGITRTF